MPGVQEIQDTQTVAEVAFTGDTTIDFLKGTGEATQLALSARLLIMELTFLDDSVTVEKARVRYCFFWRNAEFSISQPNSRTCLLIPC